jgi:hypothetical protein
MTATVNASTLSGVIVTSDTSGSLALQTAGTTALTISSAQVVNFANSPTVAGGAFNATTATTATNLAGGGAGQVPYNTGSGATSFLAAGSSGQVLQSNGTSAPSWLTLSSGALTKIATITAAGSNIAFTGLSGYNNYMLVFDGVASSNPGYQLEMQIGVGSTTYLTANYYSILKGGYGNPDSGSVTNSDNYYVNRDKFYLTRDQTNEAVGASGYINLFNFTNGKIVSYNTKMQYQAGGGDNYLGFVYGWGYLPSNTTTKTAIQIFPEGGSLSYGSITLYGVST